MPFTCCARCSIPLPAGSDAGLCPDCLRATTVSAPAAARRGDTVATAASEPRVATPVLAPHLLPTRSGAEQTQTPPPDLSADAAIAPAAGRLPAAPPGYELIRELGHGGMGSVYLAHEQAADRTVAIKFLTATGHPTAYDRFLVEVRALARLDHPNVVRVFAVETGWWEPYFTMEYAAGGTLADLVAPGRPLPDPADAARLILAAAGGVAAAHAAGILHRDLKPGNILVQRSEVRRRRPGFF